MRILPRQRGERIRRRSERPFEAEFTVTRVDDGAGRSGDTSYGILVDLAMSGSADQYSDYNLTDEGGYLAIYGDKTVIEEGETSVVFQLVTVNDHIKEGDQTAVLTVEEGTSINMPGGLFGADAANGEASVMILDDDHWVVSLTESGQPGDPHTEIKEEGTTSAGIVLTRTHEVMTPARTGDTTYPIYATLAYDGQATAADYQMIETVVQSGGGTEEVTRDGGTTTFEIQEGQTQKSIEIKAVDDQYIELLHELLEITLTDAEYSGQTYPLGTDQLVELQIEDNDEPILRIVSYVDANTYMTDPVYVGNEFQFIDPNTSVTTQHWKDSDGNGVIDFPGAGQDKCYPVTYERTSSETEKSYYKVTAQWYGVVEEGYTMTVQATGPDGMDVPENAVTLTTWLGTIETGVIQATNEFGDSVKYYSDFTLTWTFAIGGEVLQDGDSPRSAGESTNEMYVTYDVPINTEIRHTSLHLGTVAADGDDELLDVVDDAWSVFTDRDVARRDGTTMTYYGDPTTTIGTVSGAIKGTGAYTE